MHGALTQLLGDVSLTASGSDTLAHARRALHDESELFVLLYAYADLGGCRSIVANTGAPAPLLPKLERPCPQLERAAASFTRATTRSDPRALVRAAREAHLAQVSLVQALAAARRWRGE